IVAALSLRLPYWGWPVASGVLNLLLGILIWQQWPLSGLWVIGLFVGVGMIVAGWWWVSLALAGEGMPGRAGEAAPAARTPGRGHHQPRPSSSPATPTRLGPSPCS